MSAHNIQTIRKGEWFTSVDLRDAFFHISYHTVDHLYSAVPGFCGNADTPQWVGRIQGLVQSFPFRANFTVQIWLRLLGMLTAALGLLHLRPLQRLFNSPHVDPRLHMWVRIKGTHKCLVALVDSGQTWLSTVRTDMTFLLHGVPVREMRCFTRWLGSRIAKEISPGNLERAAYQHIRTTRSVFLYFFPYLKGKHLLIQTHNTSAVFHISQQGGTRSLKSQREAQNLLIWTQHKLQ